jgi:hypothetical protein
VWWWILVKWTYLQRKWAKIKFAGTKFRKILKLNIFEHCCLWKTKKRPRSKIIIFCLNYLTFTCVQVKQCLLSFNKLIMSIFKGIASFHERFFFARNILRKCCRARIVQTGISTFSLSYLCDRRHSAKFSVGKKSRKWTWTVVKCAVLIAGVSLAT